MTRAERSLDLLTRADQESQFLEEIADFTETVGTEQAEPVDDVGERMTVDEVRVKKLFDPSQKKHRCGIVANKFGGSAWFVSWESIDPPTLEEGEWYRLTDVLLNEYQDEKELVIKEKEAVRYLLRSSGKSETVAVSKVNNIN